MFFDPATNAVFGNLGWVDHGALWQLDCVTGAERRVPIDGARRLVVREHGEGWLRIIEHGDRPRISIRPCEAPDRDIASVVAATDGWRLEGDPSVWGAPFAALISRPGASQELLVVDGERLAVRSLDLSWSKNDDYDLGYQAPTDCLLMPEAGVVIVSISRSSSLVLLDLALNTRVGTLCLGDRQGNRKLCRVSATQFLASDYDALCLVDLPSRSVSRSEILQPPAGNNTAEFVGDYVRVDETSLAVARPLSGDILEISMADFSIQGRTPVDQQPLALCMTGAGSFVARDWKTGTVARGRLLG